MNKVIGIGGIGGSGTRVFAEILKSIGYFIGVDLNKENDNLLFTRLLKDPAWYKEAQNSSIRQRIQWFTQLMSGDYDLPLDQLLDAVSANNTFPSKAYTIDLDAYETREKWAWKEPNSHIYLKHYANIIPNLKYILVLRDGRDMALSANIQQLTNWGELLHDITFDANDKEATCYAQLKYWIAANAKAIKEGSLYLGPNFLVCNFDKLCDQPAYEISRIMRFIDEKIDSKKFNALAQLPQQPTSTGRHLQSGIKFPSDLLTKVHRLNAGQPL